MIKKGLAEEASPPPMAQDGFERVREVEFSYQGSSKIIFQYQKMYFAPNSSKSILDIMSVTADAAF